MCSFVLGARCIAPQPAVEAATQDGIQWLSSLVSICRLAAFQTKLLRHALRLPGLQRLVYSTCSLHAEENELVVKAVLPEAQVSGFQLVAPEALQAWPCRGLPVVEGAECLVRTHPEEHRTDGFFLALFVRNK